MRKFLPVILLVAVCCLSAGAQRNQTSAERVNHLEAKARSYRGFVDFNIGYGLKGNLGYEADNASVTGIGSGLTFGFSTTHGYQINQAIFVGAGVGVYGDMVRSTVEAGSHQGIHSKLYAATIPVYADFRWDWDIRRNCNPFFDLRAGYQFVRANNPLGNTFYTSNAFTHSSLALAGQDTGCLYLKPTIGFRYSLSDTEGLNFGFSYDIFMPKKFNVTAINSNMETTRTVIKSKSWGALTIYLGFDF